MSIESKLKLSNKRHLACEHLKWLKSIKLDSSEVLYLLKHKHDTVEGIHDLINEIKSFISTHSVNHTLPKGILPENISMLIYSCTNYSLLTDIVEYI